jgi:hypothetical protein
MFRSAALVCAVLLFVLSPVCSVHAASSLEVSEQMPPKVEYGAVDAPDDNREAFKWLRKYSVTLYGGQLDTANLAQIFYSGRFEPSSMVALAISREFARWSRYVAWEVDGEGVKHFSQSNERFYESSPWEFDAALVGRWLYFPWNKYVVTTFAVGEGLSYATGKLLFEPTNPQNAQHLLDYMLFELTFALPQFQHWSIVTRIHHRSGVYGLFPGDIHEGSNFLCTGVKYTF